MYFEIAKRNLRKHKIRSLLAVISIVIGVMAISSIGIFGNSLKQGMFEHFQDVANVIVIYPSYEEGFSSIDKQSVKQIRKISGIQAFTPVKSEGVLVKLGNEETYTQLYSMESIEAFEMEEGKASLAGDRCVVGSNLAETFDLKTGDKISIKNKKFRIAGILKSDSFRIISDRAVIVSEKNFDEMFSKEYERVILKASIDDVQDVSDKIKEILNKKEERVRTWEAQKILEVYSKNIDFISKFLMAIAAISLFVAGVSILNIMLISAMERTKEIGVMKAIGALRREILTIFLLETLILGFAGSLIGCVFSLAGGYVICSLIMESAKYVFTPSSFVNLAQGFAFGVITVLISGLYPAWRACNFQPIEALRYE